MHVAKWGNSLAVRLPKALVEPLDLKASDDVEVTPQPGGEGRRRKNRWRQPNSSPEWPIQCARSGRLPIRARGRARAVSAFWDTNVFVYAFRARSQTAGRTRTDSYPGG